jgi:hypothetical protein
LRLFWSATVRDDAERRERRTSMAEGSTVAASCVVDDTPEIWSSIVPWLASAIELGRIPPSRIYLHHACALRPPIEALCRKLGVNSRKVEPFDPRYPHTNKTRRCATDFGDVKHVVLTDVDVVFADQPRFEAIRMPVAAKFVDLQNPPVNVLRSVFAMASVQCPEICMNTYVNAKNENAQFETLSGNFNGGMYVIDGTVLGRIAVDWAYWAHWLIARIDLLGVWDLHVDRVAFCLAVNRLRLPLGVLGDVWKFPLQLIAVPEEIEPVILQHHALLVDRQQLRQASAPQAREAIARVKSAIVS